MNKESVCSAVDVDQQGRIWTTGYQISQRGDTDFLVARFDGEGHPDSRFGESGVVTADWSGGVDISHALAFLPGGEALFLGESLQKKSSPSFFVLLKLDERGGVAGTKKIFFPERERRGEGAAMIADGRGRVVVTGHQGNRFLGALVKDVSGDDTLSQSRK